MPSASVLPEAFYARDPVTVARELVELGALLVVELDGSLVSGRIVETEAYLAQGDPACHTFRGENNKNRTMFGPPGRAYVYRIHQVHCLNFVTEAEGVGSAVLVRAVAPEIGEERLLERRPVGVLTDLTNGPGKLCQAYGIDRATSDGWDLTAGERLWVASPPSAQQVPVAVSTRIGVTAGHDLPLRFYDPTSRFVSRGPRRPGP